MKDPVKSLDKCSFLSCVHILPIETESVGGEWGMAPAFYKSQHEIKMTVPIFYVILQCLL